MKLHYRGLAYKNNSSQATNETTQPLEPLRHKDFPYNLADRGLRYPVNRNVEPTEDNTSPVAYQFSYRGTVYFAEKTHTGEVSTISSQPINRAPVATKPKRTVRTDSCDDNKTSSFFDRSRSLLIKAIAAFFV